MADSSRFEGDRRRLMRLMINASGHEGLEWNLKGR